MPRPLFVATSDWHISTLTWRQRPDIVGDSIASLRQIVDYCLQHKLPLVGAGDLLDSQRPDVSSLALLLHLLDKMQEAGLPVWYIQGQHERSTPPWLSLHEWPQHVSSTLFSISGLMVYGFDWVPPATLAEILELLPSADIVICHQVWGEHMGSICHPEGNLTAIPHARLVVTGDYHVHQATQHRGSTGQDLTVLSPGAISLRNVGETPDKAFFVVNDDLSYFSVPLQTRALLRARLNTPEELDEFCQTLRQRLQSVRAGHPVPQGLEKPIQVVQYVEDLPEVYRRLQAAVGKEAHLFLQPLSKQTDVLVDVASPDGQPIFPDLITATTTLMQQAGDSAAEQLAVQRLLRSPEPESELNLMYEEHLRS